MPRRVKLLSSLEVKRLKKVGFYFLGGVPGFALKIQKNSASYLLRYKDPSGKAHDCFIGTREVLSLSQARDMAMKLKAQIINGIDPLEEKRLAREKAILENTTKRYPTFREVAELWVKDRVKNGFFRYNQKGPKQTLSILNNHVYPYIGKKKHQCDLAGNGLRIHCALMGNQNKYSSKSLAHQVFT